MAVLIPALRRGLWGALAVWMAGCAPAPAADPPAATPVSTLAETDPPTDAEGKPLPPGVLSRAMRAYYADVERSLRAQGLMRTEIAPKDAPLTRERLIGDFLRIALYDEYADAGRGFIARLTPSHLRRWEQPVRMVTQYGASVPQAQRRATDAEIRAYATRLQRASGHPVSLVPEGGNFTVFVVNEDERRALGPQLKTLVPGIDRASLRAITDLAPSNFCVVFAFSPPVRYDYSRAIAVIRAELPARLRSSCIEEELAQGMGLANDSPEARPSIFNDDEEFSRLTRHDEMLLRILYDPALRPGMTETQARPVVSDIATGLIGPTRTGPRGAHP